MAQRISKIIIALFAIIIGLYPSLYFFLDSKFGLLSSKSKALLENTIWNTAFYTHIILGGVALLIGWLQFNSKLRIEKPSIHRKIGTIYVLCVFLSSLASIGIAFSATGGFIPAARFICLGITWFTTTLLAYFKIRSLQIEQHRKLMIYSYAACFAAVTLRIWLPLLMKLLGDFTLAYSIVAWLCWVPNILVAGLIVKKLKPTLA